MRTEDNALDSFIRFDWKAATLVTGVLGMALIFWLSKYFLTIDRYEQDKKYQSEILNLRLEQIQMDSRETRQAVREFIAEQKKHQAK